MTSEHIALRQIHDDLAKLRTEVLQAHAASLDIWRDLVRRCEQVERQIQQYRKGEPCDS